MSLNQWFVIITMVVLTIGCESKTSKTSALKNGDILFCGTTSSNLSDAINTVTQTEEAHNYSHMGILSVTEGIPTVMHAYPEKGVCEEPLDTFVKHREFDSSMVYVYRLKDLDAEAALKAVAMARKLLGRPYNDGYVISKNDQEQYYCSQLVYEAFAHESAFTLYPMNFKAPDTEEFYDSWVSYYEELNMEIPQGKLGCNPNKMATNERLIHIGKLSLADSTLLKY